MREKQNITEGQYDDWKSRISTWISEAVSPFENDSPEEREERILRGSGDKLFFFKTYLPHYFNDDFGEFHREWCAEADSKDAVYLVGVPREHAKSTFWSFGIPIWNTVYEKRKFHIYISETSELATEFALSVRMEFEENKRLRHDFGDLKGFPWTAGNFVTSNGIRHWSRGYGEPIRGRKHREHRPDYVVVDDFESDLSVLNQKATRQKKNWLKDAVINSIGIDSGGLFVYVSNLFSPQSAISQLIAARDEEGKPLYKSSVYKAWIDRGTDRERPLWPARWTPARLMARERLIGSRSFNKEYMNEVEDANAEFKRSQASFYERSPPIEEMDIVAFCDPSGESGSKNDYRAVITVGMHRDSLKMYVLDAWIKHKPIESMLGHCYLMHATYRKCLVGIEENMFKEFLHEALRNYAKENGGYIHWHAVHNSSNKYIRIVNTLSYLYERGMILFKENHSDQGVLLDQLCMLEDRNVNDDGPDALQGAVNMLQKRTGRNIDYRRIGTGSRVFAGPVGNRGIV